MVLWTPTEATRADPLFAAVVSGGAPSISPAGIGGDLSAVELTRLSRLKREWPFRRLVAERTGLPAAPLLFVRWLYRRGRINDEAEVPDAATP